MNNSILQGRFKDLASKSYKENRYMFTGFLSESELSDYYAIERELYYAKPLIYGGYEGANRCIVRFGDEENLNYTEDFPIVSLLIKPLNKKFSDDLNHRDFLGAIMNLGIERSVLGDIIVRENETVVFCMSDMAAYIADNLSRIKHTSVSVCVTEKIECGSTQAFEERMIQVMSERLDAVISKTYNISRNEALIAVADGNVYLNGRQCTENAKILVPGDKVSVRGRGKFIFSELLNVNKKGKTNCMVKIYK